MIEIEKLGARDMHAVAPCAGMAVRTRDHQPVQHGEINGALDIAAEAAAGEKAGEHGAAAGLRPEAAEHQIGSDTRTAQFRQFAAVKARQHDRAARMPRRRGDQLVEQAGGFDLIAPAERLDHALDVSAPLPSVLDEVEIFVSPDLLDADEHGPATCSAQSTTRILTRSSKNGRNRTRYLTVLAPQNESSRENPSISAPRWPRKHPNRGSWV